MRNKEFMACKIKVVTAYLNKVMTLSGAFERAVITNEICSATITPTSTSDMTPFQFQPCFTKDDNFHKIFCLSKNSTSQIEATATCSASHFFNGRLTVFNFSLIYVSIQPMSDVHLDTAQTITDAQRTSIQAANCSRGASLG